MTIDAIQFRPPDERPFAVDCMKTDVEVVSAFSQVDAQPGCLLQIHPVVAGAGLIYLQQEPITVGRDESCSLHLIDKSVSRGHAVVGHDGVDSYVKDCASTNGTWVNNVRIPIDRFRLVPGDQIRFGTHVFKYLSTGDIEAQYHEAAYTMMTRDGSTGVLNKQSLMENFDREINRALRRGRQLSLILIDIDHFKQINDRFGHLAGDQVLHGVCQEVQQIVGSDELFARFGGEEFAILLPEESLTFASDLAERCRDAIEEASLETCAGSIKVTISLGVAELREVMDRVCGCDDLPGAAEYQRQEFRRELISLSDERLYAAKTAGRNQVGC